MEKNIKDYAHLYLGQQVRLFNYVVNEFSNGEKRLALT